MSTQTLNNIEEIKNIQVPNDNYSLIDYIYVFISKIIVKIIPKWVAPNLIKFSSLFVIIFTYYKIMKQDQTLIGKIEQESFFLAASSLTFAVLLQNIAKQQEKRANSNKILNYLFNNCIDAYIYPFAWIYVLYCLKSNQCYLFIIISQATLWSVFWQEYHLKKFSFTMFKIGATEFIHISALICYVTGIYGQDIWKQKFQDILSKDIVNYIIQWDNIEIRKLILQKLSWIISRSAITFQIIVLVIRFLYVLYKTKMQKFAFLHWVPYLVLINLQYYWYSYADLYNMLASPLWIFFGFLNAQVLIGMRYNSATKTDFSMFSGQIVPTALASFFIYFYENALGIKILLFWFCLGLNALVTYFYYNSQLDLITDSLNICCFSLDKKIEVVEEKKEKEEEKKDKEKDKEKEKEKIKQKVW